MIFSYLYWFTIFMISSEFTDVIKIVVELLAKLCWYFTTARPKLNGGVQKGAKNVDYILTIFSGTGKFMTCAVSCANFESDISWLEANFRFDDIQSFEINEL